MTTTSTARPPATMTRTLITLDGAHPRVRAALADAQHMHRLVMSAYPDITPEPGTGARAAHNVLYAVDPAPASDDGALRVLVQSPRPGQWHTVSALTGEPTEWDLPPLTAGRYLFQLTANPTRRDSRTRRVLALTGKEQQIDWLRRKAATNGFTVDEATVTPQAALRSASKSLPRPQRRRPSDEFRIAPVTYRGILTVTDPDAATTARDTGLGRGKAYGCGLLLTQPA